MIVASVVEALSGRVDTGAEVTVRGWVRTRRDSKAGLSFIAVNDGSGQDNIQIVAPNTLANYDSEVLRLTAGCSVRCSTTCTASRSACACSRPGCASCRRRPGSNSARASPA